MSAKTAFLVDVFCLKLLGFICVLKGHTSFQLEIICFLLLNSFQAFIMQLQSWATPPRQTMTETVFEKSKHSIEYVNNPFITRTLISVVNSHTDMQICKHDFGKTPNFNKPAGGSPHRLAVWACAWLKIHSSTS